MLAGGLALGVVCRVVADVAAARGASGAIVGLLALLAVFGGCATSRTRPIGGPWSGVAPLTQEQVGDAVTTRGRIRGALLLEHPSVSRSPTGGYQVRVASAEKGASLALLDLPVDVLDAIWDGHDARTESVWVVVDGWVEPLWELPVAGGFDDFSVDLYQPLPSRDPWGRLVCAELLEWRYAPKFEFREVERRFGKGD